MQVHIGSARLQKNSYETAPNDNYLHGLCEYKTKTFKGDSFSFVRVYLRGVHLCTMHNKR